MAVKPGPIGRKVDGIEVWHAGSGPGRGYLYVGGDLIVPKRAAKALRERLADTKISFGSHERLKGFVRLSGLQIGGADIDTTDLPIPDLIASFRGALPIYPNHVLYHQPPQGAVEPDPDDDPLQWFPEHYATPGPIPQFTPLGGPGAGVTVGIHDTGWFFDPDARPRTPDPLNSHVRDWFRGRLILDGRPVPPPQNSAISVTEGHGPFEASIVLSNAPGAKVVGRWVKEHSGDDDPALVSDLQLAEALECQPFEQIVSISHGTYTHDDHGLSVTASRIKCLKNRGPSAPIFVAAAGNHGLERPTYPAALSCVVAVGALDEQQVRRATWSDWGPWVYTFAPGTNASGCFLTGNYGLTYGSTADEVRVDETYSGGAVWSGTSFAAPFVAGRIAALLGSGASREDAIMAVRGTVRDEGR